jgi:hypothetical protein
VKLGCPADAQTSRAQARATHADGSPGTPVSGKRELGTASTFMDAVIGSGAPSHIAFRPTAGVLHSRTFFLRVSTCEALDSRLVGVAELSGVQGGGDPLFELEGAECFFATDPKAQRRPGPSLRESRPSVAAQIGQSGE